MIIFFFFKVVLEGVVGLNFFSDIGVDDVIVKDCSLGLGDWRKFGFIIFFKIILEKKKMVIKIYC